MNLELVYDASATPSGCCRRHDCDVTALYVNQTLDSSSRRTFSTLRSLSRIYIREVEYRRIIRLYGLSVSSIKTSILSIVNICRTFKIVRNKKGCCFFL